MQSSGTMGPSYPFGMNNSGLGIPVRIKTIIEREEKEPEQY